MSRRKLYNPPAKIQPRPGGGATLTQAQFTIEQRSGPLPDPATLREYESILPQAADRIFSLAEREQVFAHTYNLNEQKARGRATLLGQVFGFVLGILGVAGAVVLSVYGKELGGVAIFVGAVGTLIFTAVWGKRAPAKKSEAEQKP